jgi:hypothetical protein
MQWRKEKKTVVISVYLASKLVSRLNYTITYKDSSRLHTETGKELEKNVTALSKW